MTSAYPPPLPCSAQSLPDSGSAFPPVPHPTPTPHSPNNMPHAVERSFRSGSQTEALLKRVADAEAARTRAEVRAAGLQEYADMSDRVPPAFSFCGSRLDLCAVACSAPSRRCHLLSFGALWACHIAVLPFCLPAGDAAASCPLWLYFTYGHPVHPWLRFVRAVTYLRALGAGGDRTLSRRGRGCPEAS